MDQLLWFTEVVRNPVFVQGSEIGKVEDAVLRLEEARYPVLTGFLVSVNDTSIFISSDKLVRLTEESVATDQALSEFSAFERRPQEILIERDLLNHHLIWTKSKLRPRLVTAKDVGFNCEQTIWRAVSIDAATAHRSRWLKAKRSAREHSLVDWLDLVPLVGHVPSARKRLELRSIRKLHPAQLADLLEEASEVEGQEILGALQADPEFEADVVEELAPARQRDAIRHRTDTEVGELLSEMEPDDAVDLLLSLDQDRREGVLAAVPVDAREPIIRLLNYHPESAGGLMTTDVITLDPNMTVADACEVLRNRDALPHNLWSIFLTDDSGHLYGQIAISAMISADQQDTLAKHAETEPPVVQPGSDLSEVAVLMADYNLAALAVVDDDGLLLGSVTVDDVLPRTITPSWRRRQEALSE
ncbi:magnesium transporter MgtE N-terminal domain-containing protein [Ferrimicrobium acidiphilum]|uniref:magnesium transporter MgtE N-terminal domain-containing protein n=1 Tax=Ferrimicrobium acidiphilum TaxID=121039 RepID=UPI0023F13828|nr:CBS domain-containing protein [Ferrimicrobium acidiphilum]MCL5054181.1 CBS domain-containing protein [Gammaproteobacteria bacterium]